ncbi:MAG: tyrosine-protein phosphatase [bacterium]
MNLKVFLSLFLPLAIIFNLILPANASHHEAQNKTLLKIKYEQYPVFIPHFNKVDTEYYRGGQPKNKGYKELSQLGIKTIIDLRQFDRSTKKEEKLVEKYCIKFISIPMNPFNPPSQEQIKYFFSIINNPQNQPVFVHCREGKDRTGIMTALYRINEYNWTTEQAYQEMLTLGYHQRLYPRQKWFLFSYKN